MEAIASSAPSFLTSPVAILPNAGGTLLFGKNNILFLGSTSGSIIVQPGLTSLPSTQQGGALVITTNTVGGSPTADSGVEIDPGGAAGVGPTIRALDVYGDAHVALNLSPYRQAGAVGLAVDAPNGNTLTLTAYDAGSGSTNRSINLKSAGSGTVQANGSPLLTNPMTTAGDLVVGTAGGNPSRLGIGSNGSVLVVSAGAVAWGSAGAVSFPMTASTDMGFQPNSVTNNALDLHNNASAVNGLQITGTATGSDVGVLVIGSDTNRGVTINAAGSGVISLASTSTGTISLGQPVTGLQDKGGQWFNVKAYGAKGDHTTDDTTAINAAITAAQTASNGYTGAVVFFPTGGYVISSTLNVTADNITFVGTGPQPPFLASSDGSLLIWNGASTTTPMVKATGNGFRMERMGVTGQNTAAIGVQLVGVTGPYISDVSIVQCTYVMLDLVGSSPGVYRGIVQRAKLAAGSTQDATAVHTLANNTDISTFAGAGTITTSTTLTVGTATNQFPSSGSVLVWAKDPWATWQLAIVSYTSVTAGANGTFNNCTFVGTLDGITYPAGTWAVSNTAGLTTIQRLGRATGVPLRLTGPGDNTADVNYIHFDTLQLTHVDQPALVMLHEDTNYFTNTAINYAAGLTTPPAIAMHGASAPGSSPSRNSVFSGVSPGAQGVVLYGTGQGSIPTNQWNYAPITYTSPAGGTIWYGYEQGNGEPAPYIGTGALLTWQSSTTGAMTITTATGSLSLAATSAVAVSSSVGTSPIVGAVGPNSVYGLLAMAVAGSNWMNDSVTNDPLLFAYNGATTAIVRIGNAAAGASTLRVASVASQVNGLRITGSATTAAVLTVADGTDTNIGTNYNSKGTGTLGLNNTSTGNVTLGNSTGTLSVAAASSTFTNNVTVSGQSIVIANASTDVYLIVGNVGSSHYAAIGLNNTAATVFADSASNDGFVYQPDATAVLRFGSGATSIQSAFRIASVASQVNGLLLTGSATGNAVTQAAVGTDSNIVTKLDGKGTSGVSIGTVSTGAITLGQATTISTGGLTVSSGQSTMTPSAVGNVPLTLQGFSSSQTGDLLDILQNSAGNTLFQFSTATTAGDGFAFQAKAAGTSPIIQVISTGTNEGMQILTKGSGTLNLGTAGSTAVTSIGNAAGIQMNGSINMQSNTLTNGGAFTITALTVTASGGITSTLAGGFTISSASATRSIQLQNGVNNNIVLVGVASAVNQVNANNAATGNPFSFSVTGDTNLDFRLTPAGTGVIDLHYATIALGGGSAATLGTIGGSGPTTAAQHDWVQIKANGATRWIPAWT